MSLHLSSALQPSAGLVSLTYRSRAATHISDEALATLGRAASSRNLAEGVTGLMVYDDGRFFQWLEGPVDGLSRIWDSVRRDPRHTDIEEVRVQPTPSRMFAGWDMRVLDHGHGASRREPDVGSLPEVVRRSPPARLAAFARELIAVRPLDPDPSARELVHLLLAADPAAAADLAYAAHARIGLLALTSTVLFEPVARQLGDLWDTDDCSELEVTIAMCRLQVIVRNLGASGRTFTAGLPSVLVAPQPGETHILGSTLASELLWQAGCDAQLEFPATNDALVEVVSETWFDALDLSLSTAMRREDSLDPMAATITLARHASKNPAIAVVVGGRWFSEHPDEGGRVGADVACSTSAVVVPLVARALRRPRGVR
jgi:hypothetical protein